MNIWRGYQSEFNLPFILEHIIFISKNTSCTFNNEYFFKSPSTAMGTS